MTIKATTNSQQIRLISGWDSVILPGGLSAEQLLTPCQRWCELDRFLIGPDFPLANQSGQRREIVGLAEFPFPFTDEAAAWERLRAAESRFVPSPVPIALWWWGLYGRTLLPELKSYLETDDLTCLSLAERFRNRQNVPGYLALESHSRGNRVSLIEAAALPKLQPPFYLVVSLTE